MAAQLGLGFASGMPLALTGDTLQAWMKDRNVDLTTIGLFSLVSLPYLLKFVWSPLMDRFVPPILGRRRGWILVTQVALIGAIVAQGLCDPSASLMLVAIVAMTVAFLSASQDIVIDAYRTDVLPAEERGAGVAVSSAGYRIAMMTSGAGALILSGSLDLPWMMIYWIMAAAMGIGICATFFAPEPTRLVAAPETLGDAIVKPFLQFWFRQGGILTLVFVALFRLPDVLAGIMTLPFMLELGIAKEDIGWVRQFVGLWVVTAGSLAGGVLVAKLSLRQCLWIFAIVQCLSNVGFLILARAGPSYWVMFCVVIVESFCTGLTLAGFMSFLISQCDPRYSATQYALLSSVMALARVFGGAPTGYVAQNIGWAWFFVVTIAAGLPGILLLPWVGRRDYNKDAALSASQGFDVIPSDAQPIQGARVKPQ